jgi:hypothetical protein
LSAPARDTVCELLTQSLTAWGVRGDVRRAEDGTIVVTTETASAIRIEKAADLPFRWMVSIGERQRGAVSLVAVLRRVRTALDPGYANARIRVALAPLVLS